MMMRNSSRLVAAGIGGLFSASLTLAAADDGGALMQTPMRARSALGAVAPSHGPGLDTLESEARRDDRPQDKRVLTNACGGKTTPAYWIKQLEDRDPDARVRAAQALGEMRDRTAVAAFVGTLKDGDRNVRLAAVQALGRMGPLAVAGGPALRQMLTENDARLRDEASKALEKIGAAEQK